jgi:membrane associated rhomboid family serine protease
MALLAKLKHMFGKGDGLSRLLLINGLVFLLIQFYLLLFFLLKKEPPLGEDMALAGTDSWSGMLKRPWALISHMFAHVELGHFVLNLLGLYVCGDLFRRFVDARHLVAVYLLSGLSGFALYFVMYNVFPALNHSNDTFILGASAAVMGIVIAAVTLKPRYSVKLFGIFDIQLMWLGVVLVLLDLVSIRKGDNTGGHIGHLGGALFGFWYANQWLKGKDMAKWLVKLLDRFRRLFRPREVWEVRRSNPRFKTDEEFNVEKKKRQRRVDEILDKIGRSGYDSLSKEEKDFLFRNSQK